MHAVLLLGPSTYALRLTQFSILMHMHLSLSLSSGTGLSGPSTSPTPRTARSSQSTSTASAMCCTSARWPPAHGRSGTLASLQPRARPLWLQQGPSTPRLSRARLGPPLKSPCPCPSRPPSLLMLRGPLPSSCPLPWSRIGSWARSPHGAPSERGTNISGIVMLSTGHVPARQLGCV